MVRSNLRTYWWSLVAPSDCKYGYIQVEIMENTLCNPDNLWECELAVFITREVPVENTTEKRDELVKHLKHSIHLIKQW